MDNNDREDIYEGDRLSESVELESLSYETYHHLLVSFYSEVLLPEMEAYGVDKQTLKIANYVTSQAAAFLEGQISPAELKQCRIFTWMLHDKEKPDSKERHLMRVIVMLTGEEDETWHSYGVEMACDALLSCLLDLGKGFCKQFANYAIEKLAGS